MRFSRLALRLMALPALTALLHAQSLACCWNMPGPEKPAAVANIDVKGMQADHSCCRKESVPEDGVLWAAPGMGCTFAVLEAAMPSAAATLDLEMAAPEAAFEHPSVPPFFFAAGLSADTGPPRFLALRRLLI